MTVALKYLGGTESNLKEPVTVRNFDPQFGFLGTEQTLVRMKKIQISVLHSIMECISRQKLSRSAMQILSLMLVDVLPEGISDFFHPGLRDCVEGYSQWLESLGKSTPDPSDLINLLEDPNQRAMWLKRRVVTLKEDGWEEEVLPPTSGMIGMFVFYMGE
jgi:hypothetical protein